nr:zinc finger, CCHC-type [Tanacetum cinerariifolium]
MKDNYGCRSSSDLKSKIELKAILAKGFLVNKGKTALFYKSLKELKVLLSIGVHLNGHKRWLSLNENGQHCEMISIFDCLVPNREYTSRNESNYYSRSLMIALNAKNKIKIINGEFVEPKMDSELRALWERNNDMSISWILNTVQPIKQFKATKAVNMVMAHDQATQNKPTKWTFSWTRTRGLHLKTSVMVFTSSAHHPKSLQLHPPFSTVAASLSFGKGPIGTMMTMSAEATYMAEDASSKKLIVSNFSNYKITDSRPVMEQYNELLGILRSHLCIEESLRMQDSDKPKGNNVASPLVVNMVEHNNSSRKHGHLKKDCKGGKVGNKANGSGTNVSVVGSTNSLKVSINSIIESKDDIFNENRFSSVPRPSFKIPNRTEDIGGSVVLEEVTKEVVTQQPEPELRKGKMNKTPKDFGPEFHLYLIKGTRDEVSDQQSCCFNVEDDPKTFDEAMKS